MTYALTAPLLDACVLGILNRGDAYGYSLTQEMKRVVDISESTLYPVLRRLQQAGGLTVYDRPYQGRNRRYYAITKVGKALLESYREEWKLYQGQVERLLWHEDKGGMEDEQG